ncbi:MAG: thiol-disulfide oxidoreductase DCC family protein [Acetobacteraceae bacterium]
MDQEKATVFYDGACPVCSREVAQYRRLRGAEALRFVDASSCDAAAFGAGLTREAALARMHVREADGRLVSGAAAFAAIWRRLPAFAWAAPVLEHRFVSPVAELGYRAFLRVRRAWRR